MLPQSIIQKICSAFKGKFLGASLFLTDEEKSALYDEVGKILSYVSNSRGESIRPSDYKIVTVALVELTKTWDSDEDTWRNYISRILLGSQSEFDGKIYSQVCQCIGALGSNGEMFLFECFQKKFYTSICSHSFSPKKSTFSFFDMCWEIYCKDLFQEYEKDDEILDSIVKSLHNKISKCKSEDEDIKLGSKTYGFRAGIKGLAIERQDLLKQLLAETFETLNDLTGSRPIQIDSYFKSLINEWWSEKSSEFGVRRTKKRIKREYIAQNYSQIKTKYVLVDGDARLQISSFRLHDNFEYEPYITIKINGQVAKVEPIPTMGSGILLATKTIEYSLDEFSFKDFISIDIEITHSGKIVFQSKNALKRDFIVFDGERETGAGSLVPGTYFLYTTNIGKMTVPEDTDRAYGNHLYSFNAREGEIVRSSERIIFFENIKSDRSICFYSSEQRNLDYQEAGETFKVIEGELFLDVSPKLSISDLGVRINNTVVALSSYEPFSLHESQRFNITSGFQSGKATRVSVFRYSDNHIMASVNVLKFLSISITYDRPIYYGDKLTGKATIQADSYILEKKIDASAEENSIRFGEGEILLSPPVLRWKIDGGEWQIKASRPIYYKEIGNSSLLDVDIPLTLDYIVGLTQGAPGPLKRTADEKHYYLGQTIHSIVTSSTKETTLFIRVGNEYFELSRVMLKPIFLVDPIAVDSNKFFIHWMPESFVGDKSLRSIKIRFNDLEEAVVLERTLSLEEPEAFSVNSLKEGYYDITIAAQTAAFLCKEEQLFKHRYLLGNIKNLRFKSKIIKLAQAIVFGREGSKIVGIRPLYISDIRFLTDQEGYDVYSGRLFLYNRLTNERNYLDYMKDSSERYIKINPLRIELKTLRSCYIGYGLDKDDPEFEYDGEFAVSFDGKLTISSRDSMNIDFYTFDVIA